MFGLHAGGAKSRAEQQFIDRTPENYASGVKSQVVDKPTKEVYEYYTSPAAIEAAHRGEAMRNSL